MFCYFSCRYHNRVYNHRKGMGLPGVASCILPWVLIQDNIPRRGQWREGPFFPGYHVFTVPFSHRGCCHLLWADVPVPHNLSFAFCQTRSGQLWFPENCSLRNLGDLLGLKSLTASCCSSPKRQWKGAKNLLILMKIPLVARGLLIWHYFHLCDRQSGLVLHIIFLFASDSWTHILPLCFFELNLSLLLQTYRAYKLLKTYI